MLLWEEEEPTCRSSSGRPLQHGGGCEETRQEEEEKEAAVRPQEETLLSLRGQHACRVSSGNFYTSKYIKHAHYSVEKPHIKHICTVAMRTVSENYIFLIALLKK